MRTQHVRVQTGRKKQRILIAGIIIIIIGILTACWGIYHSSRPFVAPAFEQDAIQGTPDPESNMGYSTLEAPTGYQIALAGTMYQQEDSSLLIYLTNPQSNEVNIKCEIRDEQGTLLYESGVLKPGEYVERLKPLQELENKAMRIELKIYSYEKNTWYSKGTLEMSNTLQPY